MTKEACLFPGQGLSAADMVTFYNRLINMDPKFTARRIAETQEALNRVHGSSAFNVLSSFTNMTSPSFKSTAFIQPVTYALSTTVYEAARVHGITSPGFVAGLSVGEYAAITAAGVIDYEVGLDIVTNRGKFTQDVYNKTPSTLVLLMGASLETATKICSQSKRGVCPEGAAEIAIVSAPDMIVVGCAEKSVPTVEQLAKNAGVKRTRSLKTTGAFHTQYMEEAAERMSDLLDQYSLGKIQIPIVANLSGAILESGTYSASNLVRSMTEPVQWAHTLFILKYLTDRFIETGPGRTLQSLNEHNGIPEIQTVNILNCFIPQLVG